MSNNILSVTLFDVCQIIFYLKRFSNILSVTVPFLIFYLSVRHYRACVGRPDMQGAVFMCCESFGADTSANSRYLLSFLFLLFSGSSLRVDSLSVTVVMLDSSNAVAVLKCHHRHRYDASLGQPLRGVPIRLSL